MKSKYYISLFLFNLQFAICNLQLFSQPFLADKIVAIVADKIIMKSEVESQYYQYVAQGEISPEIKCQILYEGMVQKLLLNQAILDSIEVTDEEVESELDRKIRYFTSPQMLGSKEALEDYYKKSILEIKEEFRDDIKNNILAQRLQAKITRDVKVTPSDVKDFFKSIPEDSLPFLNAEAEIGHIVILPKVSKEMKELAKEKILEIRKSIVEDKQDFATKAITYSEDPGSAGKGGELGFLNRGELVPEFEAVAFKLKEEEVSNVVETTFGYHIIQLIERRGEKINVRHVLVKPKTTSFDLAEPKRILDSVRNLITENKISFAEAVGKFSEDEDSKNNGGMMINPQTGTSYFEIAQLDKATYFVIDTMKVGQISQPAIFQTRDGQQAYHILWLKSESQPHRANLRDDYNRIQTVATSQKEKIAMDNWLKDKISKTYVMVSPEFQNCEVMKIWMENKSNSTKKND